MQGTIERPCLRDHVARGEHRGDCADVASCRGCVPAMAREGSVLCGRCYARLRRALDQAPDLLALIRSKADPMKAQVFDRELVSGSPGDGPPAPVAADLLDAGDGIASLLADWEMFAFEVGGRATREIGAGLLRMSPGVASDVIYAAAVRSVSVILSVLPTITGGGYLHETRQLAAFALDVHLDDRHLVEDERAWTIARGLQRWPVEDRPRWAAQPCPVCDRRTIKMTPARTQLGAMTFECSGCGWLRTDEDEGGLWLLAFSTRTGVGEVAA